LLKMLKSHARASDVHSINREPAQNMI